jgi:iron only hydrogenase large subunit-like protein
MLEILHSVYLEKDKCEGCTNCLRGCPTKAIRVRDGKAKILEDKCIDCGECIRICPYHAKQALTDPIEKIKDPAYKYTVALPAPTILGQFKKQYSIPQILSTIKELGFDEIAEVAYGAELVGEALNYEIEEDGYEKPIISSACPAVVKLIQIRFPDLVDNVSKLKSPMTVTAGLTRERIIKEKGLKPEEIGIFFITPCAAKATVIKNPSEKEKYIPLVDGAISIIDIYGEIRRKINNVNVDESTQTSSSKGFSWARSGGESDFLKDKNVLNVDGINNVINVLEEIERGKLDDIDFFEGLACPGGCVGGCLTVENSFVAKMRIQERAKNIENQEFIEEKKIKEVYDENKLTRLEEITPREPQPLDDNLMVAMEKMAEIDRITEELPGFDCGSCGSPGCRALAEDIVRGKAAKVNCIFILREKISELSMLTNEIVENVHPMMWKKEKKETE